ncbi:glycosyltransferase family 2 protein [Candidatus Falkowbacteria bacterium]|nr:glycosyltransferase family 2 protein [Candidatus Falkowbacteria bacterium]
MKLSIIILTFNAIKYIDDCFKSILNQDWREFKILVVDNASDDGTLQHIKENYPEVTVLQNFKNLGFAKGTNQGIKFWDSEYVLLVNQDVILQPDFLSKIMMVAEQHPDCGSFTGKVLKLSHIEEERDTFVPDIIDTAGIAVSRARRFYDRGAGQEDKGQFDLQEEIFGPSGALALYRRTALESMKINSHIGKQGYKFANDLDYFEYFDESYFMYKEDIDLAWRLQWAGWKCLYVPAAEAHHYRTAFGLAEFSNRRVARDRRTKSKFVNRLSFRNHWLTLLKNDAWANFWLHSPWIFFYELKKFAYIVVFEWNTVRLLLSSGGLFFSTLRKRKQVLKMRQRSPAVMRRWFQ